MDTHEKQAERVDIAVFKIRRASTCAECGEELDSGSYLRVENERPLCLGCADLDHLYYLPRGDAALTRRATKHSKLHAVVLQWSRTRKRYERQGVLVEEAALDRAEAECLEDADARARIRERSAVRRQELDAEYVRTFSDRIIEQYPGCPLREATSIAEHACAKASGRVGRTAAAKRYEPKMIELAVRAHIRHEHTNYDDLLGRGYDRDEARARVLAKLEATAEAWKKK